MLIPNSNGASPEAFINKGSNIACIIQCSGLWFANNNFGVSWKLYQGVVKPTETLEAGVCHISLSNSDKKQIVKDNAEAKESKPAFENDVTVESDDEEDEQDTNADESSETPEPEEEPEPEPEPEPVVEEKPKKKRVVKKKA